MKMILRYLLAATVLVQCQADDATSSPRTIDDLSELEFDENRHLSNNYLLVPDTCTDAVGTIELDQREVVYVTEKLQRDYSMEGCPAAVCLNWGTNEQYLQNYYYLYAATSGDFRSWIQTRCQKKEIGWISYWPNPVNLYWRDLKLGSLRSVGVLKRLEKNTQWRKTYLGHRFVLKDAVTGEFIKEYTVQYDSINPIGVPEPIPDATREQNWESRVSSTRNYEWTRKKRQTKHYGPNRGFEKKRTPDAVFGSIQAYYYNNRHKGRVREEWYEQSKGIYVNWWAVDAFMIYPPWDLKREWHDSIQPLVEEWCGVELERTDIYGIREYTRGAQLLEHVDRGDTHICSVIINVDSWGFDEGTDWPVQIWDIDGLGRDGEYRGLPNEIGMKAGDMVYYQSHICMHGRYKPLMADGYVNIFGHYRPKQIKQEL